MILTVTLNPAVDKTIQIDDFKLDQVNRVESMRIDAGGKGINVSNTIKSMGRHSRAYAVIGGQAGEFIKNAMYQESIDFDYLKVESETRTNLKIVDKRNGYHTDINESGPQVDEVFEDQIINWLQAGIQKNDVLVLSGSLLPGLTAKVYKNLVQVASEKEAKVILDADGERLIEALNSSPDIIKPNIYELSELAGKELKTKYEIIKYTKTLLEDGKVKKGILVSLGDEGALWITNESTIEVEAIKTDVKSTVGAGDAMVAALAVALSENLTDEEMLKMATAAAIARISTDGPIQCSQEVLNTIAEKVVLKEAN